jgi:putative DNA primase/helicase
MMGTTRGELFDDNVSAPELAIRWCDSIEERTIDFLFGGRLAIGHVTIVAGLPGHGKSVLASAVAAALSTGASFPSSGVANEPRKCLIWSTEEPAESIIRPRLRQLRADLSKVGIIDGRRKQDGDVVGFSFVDLPLLESALEADPRIVLVVLDPLRSLAAGLKSNSDDDVRPMLEELQRLAGRRSIAIVGVLHVNKRSDLDAILRIGGAGAWTQVPRASFLVARDPEQLPGETRSTLAPAKFNLGKWPAPLGFAIGGPDFFTWTGEKDAVDVDDMLGPKRRDDDRTNPSDAWLRATLSDGPRPADEIFARAARDGIGRTALQGAKRRLGVVSHKFGKPGEGGWQWELPA